MGIRDCPPAMTRASLPSLVEHVEGFVQMFGANVVECGGLHRLPPNQWRNLASKEVRG